MARHRILYDRLQQNLTLGGRDRGDLLTQRFALACCMLATLMAACESVYDAAFDLGINVSELSAHYELLTSLLPRIAFQRPPVTSPLAVKGGPQVSAEAAVAVAVDRFAVPLPPFIIDATHHIRDDRSGEASGPAGWEVELRGDTAVVSDIRNGQAPWRIRLHEGLRHDPAQLLSTAAHEVAHLVLFSHGIRLETELENERLTDAAAVLAGFGPLMEQLAFRVHRHPRTSRGLTWSTQTSGYLHRSAVRYLIERREALRRAAAETARRPCAASLSAADSTETRVPDNQVPR